MGRFFSVSQINNYDPNTAFGCPRRWFYKSILKLEEETPRSARAAEGEADHKQLEQYLKGGPLPKSGRLKIGFWALPDPGDDLMLEKKFTSTLGADDHLTGVIDCFHSRPTWISPDREELREKVSVGGELIDWKTIDNKWAIKEAHELAADRQMLVYSRVLFKLVPNSEHLRISQVFFLPSDTVKKTVLVTQDRTEKAWDGCVKISSEMKEVAATPEELTPTQTDHCEMGKWKCPYFNRCSTLRTKPQQLPPSSPSELPMPEQPVAQPNPSPAPLMPPKRGGGKQKGSDLILFVGCLPLGAWKAGSLDLYVQGLLQKLSPDRDLRLLPNWEGLLADEIRSNPPAPGMYTILFLDQVSTVLVNTLRMQATAIVTSVSVVALTIPTLEGKT